MFENFKEIMHNSNQFYKLDCAQFRYIVAL